MITRVLTVVWLLFPTFHILHAVPTEVRTNKETIDEEVPISNEKMKLTEEESKSLSGLTAMEEVAKFGPALVDDKKDGGTVHKHFGKCEEIAEKQLDVPWETKKKCLRLLWAEARKEQKSLKKSKSSKNVTKDVVTLGFHLLHRIFYLMERIYIGVRNSILGVIFPELYLRPYWRYRYAKK